MFEPGTAKPIMAEAPIFIVQWYHFIGRNDVKGQLNQIVQPKISIMFTS